MDKAVVTCTIRVSMRVNVSSKMRLKNTKKVPATLSGRMDSLKYIQPPYQAGKYTILVHLNPLYTNKEVV